MSLAVLKEGEYAVAQLVNLYMTQGTLQLTDVAILKILGDSETHQPKVATLSPLASDNEGPTQFLLTLIGDIQYWIGSQRHSSLSSLLRANPHENVLVEVFVKAVTDLRSVSQQMIEGRIVQITEFTPEACTFLVEQRERLEQGWIPAKTLERGLYASTSEKERIPKDSIGRAIPVSFGKAVPYRQSLLSGMTDARANILIDSGFPAPLFPALEVQRTDADSYFAWAEKISGTGALAIDVTSQFSAGIIDAYVWISEADAWGNVWNNDIVFFSPPNAAGYYEFSIKRQPYIRVHVMAQRYIAAESAGTPNDPERAIDRKHETYCFLSNTDRAVYELASWKGGGHISMNTAENGTGGIAAQQWEGTNFPAGLRAAATIYFFGAIPTTGTLEIFVSFPGSFDVSLFNTRTTYTIAQLTTLGMASLTGIRIFHYLQVCDSTGGTGGADDGWASTKFENGDFSAHAITTNDDPNKPLSRTGTRDSRQFRVQIRSTLNQPVALAAIGMDVAFVDTLDRHGDAWHNIDRGRKVAESRRKYGIDSDADIARINSWDGDTRLPGRTS